MTSSSVSFDRVADIYDATRGIPPEVSAQVTATLEQMAAADPQTHFLEVGIGTGRIAIPLIERGYPYTGIDISEGMLRILRQKLDPLPPHVTLLQGDGTAMPFGSGSFDVVITAHVLHLIPNWQAALSEIRRVLRGVYLYCKNDVMISIRQDFDEQWRRILAGYGCETQRYGATSEEVMQVLRDQGCEIETRVAAEWQISETVRGLFRLFADRVYSNSWQIPDEIFAPAIADLQAWMKAQYPSEELILTGQSQFEISAVRWQS